MSKVEAIIEAALARYNEVHAARAKEGKTQVGFTEAELRSKITQAYIAKAKVKMGKDERKACRALIASKAAQLGVQFDISRNLDEVLVSENSKFRDWDANDNRVYEVERTVANVVDPKGGDVFAYRYVPGEAVGSLVLEYVHVHCSSNDVFDPVIGKGLALGRFENAANRKVGPFKPQAPYGIFEAIIG